MGLLDIFSKKAKRTDFLPPSFSTPPQPQGLWSIIVDRDCNHVTGRPPCADDFLARPPAIDNAYGGTFPPFKHNPHLGREENSRAFVAHCLQSELNRINLDKAVFLLSQTDDGARLLRKSKEMGFRIVFDPELCAEENALGMCDFANKKIPLAAGRTGEEVALTLKHELQHMEDIGNGLHYGLEDTPDAAIRANRLLEGNARVSESVAAAEILLGSPEGPPRQFRSPVLFNLLWDKMPHMAQAAHTAMPDATQQNWRVFAAKVFPAYFGEEKILRSYDQRYANFLAEAVPDISDSQKFMETQRGAYDPYQREAYAVHKSRIDTARSNTQKMFTRSQDASEMAACLTIRAVPYAKDLAAQGGFSFESPRLTAQTSGMDVALGQIKANMEIALSGSGKTHMLDLPVLQPAAAVVRAPSPYQASAHGKNGQTDFQAIQLPLENDGTAHFIRGLAEMRSGRTEIDRINFTIDSKSFGQWSPQRGAVLKLLDAGLLAPIAAFPDSYLMDLHKRITLYAGEKDVSQQESQFNDSGVKPAEIALLRHWQTLKDKGFDPVWGDAHSRQNSLVAQDSFEMDRLADFLQPVTGEKQERPALKRPATVSEYR